MAPLPSRGGAAQGNPNWVERYRRFWERSFDRLDAYLREIQSKADEPTQNKGKPRSRKKK